MDIENPNQLKDWGCSEPVMCFELLLKHLIRLFIFTIIWVRDRGELRLGKVR